MDYRADYARFRGSSHGLVLAQHEIRIVDGHTFLWSNVGCGAEGMEL